MNTLQKSLAFFITAITLFTIDPTSILAVNNDGFAYLQENNILESTDEPCVADDLIHRGQFVKWVMRNSGFYGDMEPRGYFSDEPNNPYADMALELGGIPKTENFNANASVTAYEAISIIFKIEAVSGSDVFPKNQVIWTDFTAENGSYLWKAREIGIWQPIAENLFGAHTVLTCQQAADMLQKFDVYEKLPPKNPAFRVNNSSKTYSIGIKKEEEKTVQEMKLDMILDILEDKFYEEDVAKREELLEKVIVEVIKALGDPNSVYMTPEETKNIADSRKGEVEGIGAQISRENSAGHTIITTVFPNSPAEKAGLRTGDIIIQVDGVDVAESLSGEIANYIRGAQGTSVNITVLRGEQERSFTVMREKVKIQYVTGGVQDNILTIEMRLFANDTVKDFKALLEEYARDEDLKGIILDLRGNLGGQLDVVIGVLNHLLPYDSTVIWQLQRDARLKEETTGLGEFADIPLIVLVNERSASGSEIVAAAVQDHNRGIVMGTQTFGKGTAQQTVLFSDGSSFRYTLSQWITPREREINGVGVTPDIVVESAEKMENGRDPLLEKAQLYINTRRIPTLLKAQAAAQEGEISQ